MKAREWREVLEEQRKAHGKVLFTVTELANLGLVGRNALNVELSRLRRQGIAVRYAHGLYGLPGAVSPEDLLPAIDSRAYMTGIYALHLHRLVTQVPTAITCFTDRRSPRARVRSTPLGRFVFVCVRSQVYDPPADGPVAGPEQALCDFIYLCRRNGVAPESQVTFRVLGGLRAGRILRIAKRYPSTVGTEVRRLLAGSGTRAPRAR
ncbi:MAG: hypothetical protein HY721_15525 [Planctomycetes bacterium]|nr:hypothetical protein [Planctomycetota bacterium]